jgi:hypothetical protein
MRISKDELLNLTPADWATWFDRQHAQIQEAIVQTVESLRARGFNDRQAMVSVYAIIEDERLRQLEELHKIPHVVRES